MKKDIPYSVLRRERQFSGSDRVTLVALLLAAALPLLTSNILVQSVASQALIGFCGALAVHLMLRLGLLNFSVPGFMAVGGYAAAIAAEYGVQDLFALLGIAFLAPVVLAIPIGWIVLRLKGVYFVLVTYLMTEIVQLVIVETPSLTGGTNGLIGFPPTTFFGTELVSGPAVYYTCYAAAIVALFVALWSTRSYGDIYDSQAHNDTLAQSLGMDTARYKAQAFAVSAGVAGLGGFALVQLLITAHPLSFTAASSVNYIAYVLVGGAASLLGALLGTVVLVTAITQFSWSGEYSLGLFGLLLIFSVLFMRDGVVGVFTKIAHTIRGRNQLAYPATRGEPT